MSTVVIAQEGGGTGGNGWIAGLLLIGVGAYLLAEPQKGLEIEGAAVYELGHIAAERPWAERKLQALAAVAGKEHHGKTEAILTAWEAALKKLSTK